MAEKKAPSRRLAKPDGAAEKAPSRSNHMQNTQAPRKRQPLIRNDVIRCEKCGEDYSVTYKRCPFCDERPGRPGAPAVPGPPLKPQRVPGGPKRTEPLRPRMPGCLPQPR